jgi:PilZ domain
MDPSSSPAGALPPEGGAPDRESIERYNDREIGDEQSGYRYRLRRFPVEDSRPVAIRPLDQDGRPNGPWKLADILDISIGGLCLLVMGELQIHSLQQVELDVRSHPSFPWVRQSVEVRWLTSANAFTTLGVAFHQPLTTVPRLEPERRSVRRDSNLELWEPIP